NIVNALHQNGIPAKVSNTAGTFVCNHLMYGVCHYAAQKGNIKAGFMHIPYLPSQVVDKPNQPSMAVETVRATLETIVHVLAYGESYKAQDINYTTPHE
ncbi:MAG: pyroglutamyl-peptidase I, partial [Veillonella sp.]|nr:pyroglutamyl-peptidase I [Veillonella sp.]